MSGLKGFLQGAATFVNRFDMRTHDQQKFACLFDGRVNSFSPMGNGAATADQRFSAKGLHRIQSPR